jgi:uncharacterized membrane protein SpoIIM required for sporulation
MQYIAAIFILWSALYILNFARYNLKKKNKLGAAGAVLLAILIITLPIIALLINTGN